MPSKTKKQARFMASACKARNPKKTHGISRKVACEYYGLDHATRSKKR